MTKIADCIEYYLADHEMPKESSINAAFTTQLEQTQESQMNTVRAGGPGSGRHKENHDALTQNGWEVTKSNSAGKQYGHMSNPGMYINRDNGAWGYRIPGKMAQSTDSGRDLKSLSDHLATTSKAGSKGIY
jgi:hypothetical protein